MNEQKRPRMADIAREARVNRITVSRAFSNPELVAKETLERIHAAVAKTGYIPNQIARGLKADHSNIVSLVTPAYMSGVYGQIVEQLSGLLYRSGLVVNLFPVQDVEGHLNVVLRELAGWRPAAIVLFGATLTEESQQIIRNARMPVVELLNYSESSGTSSVGYDHRLAASLLTSHLLDQGYRKICYIHSARAANIINADRLAGFTEAIRVAGGPILLRSERDQTNNQQQMAPRDHICGIELKSTTAFHAGFELMGKLANWENRPEAVLFASDMVAVGALQYCLVNGIAPGKDIGLCGFDGIELTSVMRPQLTCLDFPYQRVIAEGARQILARATDQSTSDEHIRIPVAVLHRETT
ncbi:LacI family DNA-binding transcriptional regulator [Devosia rhodophyticola]|uniref:LacI family DNA-binding transcriptional regulator n=1 Tax=Devosia rhodophyticola TaxID=3026423 RepID=A0ABY7YZ18_9HYPH|nr:LacI family DNA-binding transcriptional regulator [Devosia rhodophyticola]WDR06496.1 LacI family DNA-binding transcriptional regulator [Devosia rhodophyticola]